MSSSLTVSPANAVLIGAFSVLFISPVFAAEGIVNNTKRNAQTFNPAYYGGQHAVSTSQSESYGAQPDVAPDGSAATPEQAAEKPQDSSWHYSVGGGLAFAPKYEGAKDYEVQAVPLLEAVSPSGTYFVGTTRGAGMNLVQEETYQAGIALGFANGRQQKDSRHLQGLGDIDGGVSANIFMNIVPVEQVNVTGTLSKDFGASDGIQATVSTGYTQPFSESLSLTTSVGTTWVNDDYASSFFGVTNAQSLRTGGRLKPFSAEAGFKNVNLNLGLNYQMNDSWIWYNGFDVSRLVGDAGDSPITQKRLQTTFISAAAYTF